MDAISGPSPTRTHATWKPRTAEAPYPFFICAECGHVYAAVDDAGEMALIDDGERSLRIDLPYGHPRQASHPWCHGRPMLWLEPVPWENAEEFIWFDYLITGGYDSNCIEVRWRGAAPAFRPRWFAVKTFTGMQLKYVQPRKVQPLVFAFGDEDAYAYCDRIPCRECQFRCKSGMKLYCYVPAAGLLVRDMGRVTFVKSRLR